jgi:hypothetical protein
VTPQDLVRAGVIDYVFDMLGASGYFTSDDRTLTIEGLPSIVLERSDPENLIQQLIDGNFQLSITGPEGALEADTIASVIRISTLRFDNLYSSLVLRGAQGILQSQEMRVVTPAPFATRLALALRARSVTILQSFNTERETLAVERVAGRPASGDAVLLHGYPVLLANEGSKARPLHRTALVTIMSCISALNFTLVSVTCRAAQQKLVYAMLPSGSRILSQAESCSSHTSGRPSDSYAEVRALVERDALHPVSAALMAVGVEFVIGGPVWVSYSSCRQP